jgi:ABC-2 type transport system permease protein
MLTGYARAGVVCEGGTFVRNLTPTMARRRLAAASPIPLQTFGVLAKAGFRRYSTYRQATIAGAFTNIVFGFLRSYVLLAVAAAGSGTIAGYRGPQLMTYVWVGQGLIATVGMWGDTELATRIRTGDVVSDLLRPIHPIPAYLAVDIGRAGFAVLTRFAVPVLVGIAAFDFYLPHHAITYPMFAVSVALATIASFGCRYIVNAATYWILDSRGPQLAWTVAATLLGGLYFPLHFLPGPLVTALWLGTPFPSLLQAPLDIVCERPSLGEASGYLAVQGAWLILIFWAAVTVQRRAERKLVLQGG